MLPIDPALLANEHNSSDAQARNGNGEWEYEYDANETETFYLTLDLTSSSIPSKEKDSKQPKQSSNTPRNTEPGSPGASSASSDRDESEQGEEDSRYNGHTQSPSPSPRQSAADNRMQILDLHTENPIISYQNRFYNCNWASNLGTELLFTTPTPQNDLPALLSRPGYSLLAASSFRLVSQPAQLLHREERQNDQESDGSLLFIYGTEEVVDKIPVGEGAMPSRRKQARFLENLMTLKRQRDETDDVTVYTKIWRPPRQRKSEEPLQPAEKGSQELNSGESEGEHRESHGQRATVSELAALAKPTSMRGRPIGRPRTRPAGEPRARPGRRGRPKGRPSSGTAMLFAGSVGAGEHSSEPTELDAMIVETLTPSSWDELRDTRSTMEAEGESPGPNNQ